MKLNYPPVKSTFIIVIAVFMLTALFNNGCTKLDSFSKELSPEDIEAKFFTPKPGTPQAVLKVIAALKKQNSMGHFIPTLAKKDGFAVWDKSQINILTSNTSSRNGGQFETQDTVEVFTPIVQQDSNFVNGFFFSRIVGDSVELHLYRANDYDQYPYGKADSSIVTGERLTLKLIELDNNLFGNRNYNVSDSNLFGYINPFKDHDTSVLVLKGNFNTGNRMVVACWYVFSGYCTCGTETCEDWWKPCPKSECSSLKCVSILVNDNGTVWPADPPIYTGGGGSTPPAGGGDCTGINNCSTGGSRIVEGRVPCGGCGNGPVVLLPPEEPPLGLLWMNQNIIDSTNNNCVANILSKLKSISSKLPQIMQSVFDTTSVADFNMTLKLKNLGPNVGGRTIINTSDSNFKVEINNYFTNATNLSVVATLIHETMHCQLMDWFRRAFYRNDTTLRNNLAAKYGYLFSRETTDYNNHLAAIVWGTQGASQHQDIAIRYRNIVGETIYEYALSVGITNITLDFCKDLAWSGCQDSRAFLNLSAGNQDYLHSIINAEKDPNGTSVNTALTQPKGSPCL